jgi:hypothetical protein
MESFPFHVRYLWIVSRMTFSGLKSREWPVEDDDKKKASENTEW